MADNHSPSNPPQFQSSSTNFTLDSDPDISSLLHTLLHNSSQPSTSNNQPPSEIRRQFSGSAIFNDSSAFVDPNFTFSGSYFGSGVSMDGIDDGDFHSEEEARVKLATGRSSSKRSRAAEVHNMSEKRRRQRINEKMKALQKLIPNSNKTDKASMLDEAIEYLKQLQLQVQMLTLRNCTSSSHPFYLQGAMQQPSSSTLVNEGNTCRNGSFIEDQEAPMESMFNLSSKPCSGLMTIMSEDNNSGKAVVPEPSMARRYRSFNSSMSSKVACKDPSIPQIQLDMSQCGQSSSSGVSS